MAASISPSPTRVEIAHQRGSSETWAKYGNEHTWSVVDALVSVASEEEKPPAQVALNWLLARPGVTAPIIGARSLTQLEDNLGSVGWRLDTDQVKALDEASAKPLPYPYDHMHRA